jgi:hypothetical protein
MALLAPTQCSQMVCLRGKAIETTHSLCQLYTIEFKGNLYLCRDEGVAMACNTREMT